MLTLFWHTCNISDTIGFSSNKFNDIDLLFIPFHTAIQLLKMCTSIEVGYLEYNRGNWNSLEKCMLSSDCAAFNTLVR